MARKPVHLVADAKRPQGRDVIWGAIRKLRRFTVLELEHATRIDEQTIRSYVQGLKAAGYLTVAEPVHKDHKHGVLNSTSEILALVRDIGVEAPRVTRAGKPVTQGAGTESMWRAMRMLKSFSTRELVTLASSGGVTVTLDTAKRYVAHLHKARYLRMVERGGPGCGARYALVPARNTGPRPPQVQRVHHVWDANEGRVVWPLEARA